MILYLATCMFLLTEVFHLISKKKSGIELSRKLMSAKLPSVFKCSTEINMMLIHNNNASTEPQERFDLDKQLLHNYVLCLREDKPNGIKH